MTPQQKTAQQIYLDSVCYESDYKSVSFSKLADLLLREKIKISASSLERWSQKFDWKEKVKTIVTAATVGDGKASEIIKKSSLEKNTRKILKDFEANEMLKNDAYSVLGDQMKHYMQQMKKTTFLSLDSTRIVLKILEVTSTREDKLLDRQAMLTAAKMVNSADVLAALSDEVIEVEIDE